LPLYECILTGRFFDEEIKLESDLSNNTKDAEKDVAVKFLMKIEGETDFKTLIKAKETIVHRKEIITQDFIPDEIKLLKMSSLGQPEQISLSSETNESLYDWAKRKEIEDSFRMVRLLALRIDNLSGASWHASIPNGELFFSYTNFDGNEYYEMGFGNSKTKAKKDVAGKFIKNSKLFEWLEVNYKDKMI